MTRRPALGLAPILIGVCGLTAIAFTLLDRRTEVSAPTLAPVPSDSIVAVRLAPVDVATDPEVILDWAAGSYTWLDGQKTRSVHVDRSTGLHLSDRDYDVVFDLQDSFDERPDGLYLHPGKWSAPPGAYDSTFLFVPFRRGACRYLVCAPELPLALEWLRTTHERDPRPVPRIMKRTTDDASTCDAEVVLPEFYRRSLVEGITTSVVAAPDLTPGSILIDRGTDEGMWVGLRLRDADHPDTECVAWVYEVREHTSVICAYFQPPVPPLRWTTKPRAQ